MCCGVVERPAAGSRSGLVDFEHGLDGQVRVERVLEVEGWLGLEEAVVSAG